MRVNERLRQRDRRARRSEKTRRALHTNPAAATPGAVVTISNEYQRQIDTGAYDPLLISLVFAFDFVSIHPFHDGNGRMSRLLALLLMYRSGYDVGKYVSIEKEIERTKIDLLQGSCRKLPRLAGGQERLRPLRHVYVGHHRRMLPRTHQQILAYRRPSKQRGSHARIL